MTFVTRAMETPDAVAISGWTYEPPYDLYNMGVSGESVKELMNGLYRVVTSTDGESIGFYCMGESAQVPAGKPLGAYQSSPEQVDIGIGMRPDLTGKGLGGEFLSHVLREVVHQQHGVDIRLTVATFNERAIKLYERLGFQRCVEFDSNGTTFQTMTRVTSSPF